jgi:hypothetical protein
MDAATLNEIAPMGPGRSFEAPDDLVCWLHAIHVAHIDAGDRYDTEGYLFFFLWYCELSA